MGFLWCIAFLPCACHLVPGSQFLLHWAISCFRPECGKVQIVLYCQWWVPCISGLSESARRNSLQNSVIIFSNSTAMLLFTWIMLQAYYACDMKWLRVWQSYRPRFLILTSKGWRRVCVSRGRGRGKGRERIPSRLWAGLGAWWRGLIPRPYNHDPSRNQE